MYVSGEWRDRAEMTLGEAAEVLNVSEAAVLKWIRHGRLSGSQLCRHAPWVLKHSDVETFKLRRTTAESNHNGNDAQLGLKLQ